jgi:hypothetical protein
MISRSNPVQIVINNPTHPVSIAMQKMQDIPEIRIIEGLSTVNKKGGE